VGRHDWLGNLFWPARVVTGLTTGTRARRDPRANLLRWCCGA